MPPVQRSLLSLSQEPSSTRPPAQLIPPKVAKLRCVRPRLLQHNLQVLPLDPLPRCGHVRAVQRTDSAIVLLMRNSGQDAVPFEAFRDPINQPRLRFDPGGVVRADAAAPLFVAEILSPEGSRRHRGICPPRQNCSFLYSLYSQRWSKQGETPQFSRVPGSRRLCPLQPHPCLGAAKRRSRQPAPGCGTPSSAPQD